MVGGQYYVTALSVGAIVCIASSVAGCTSQDLKTGHLVGSTLSSKQYAILIGAFCSALLLGPILLKLNDSVLFTSLSPKLHRDSILTATNLKTIRQNSLDHKAEQDKEYHKVRAEDRYQRLGW